MTADRAGALVLAVGIAALLDVVVGSALLAAAVWTGVMVAAALSYR